jgi:hypothetical protein
VAVTWPPLSLVTFTVAPVIVSGPAVACHCGFGQALDGGVGVATVSVSVKLALPWLACTVTGALVADPVWLCPGTGPLSLPGLKQLTGYQ